MANPVQWTADKFWNQMQAIAAAGRDEKARLEAQRLRLQNAYSAARKANDTAAMAKLDPLIHENSRLRLQYTDLANQFNGLMDQARQLLLDHGITEPPVLAGLGQLQAVLIPVAWIAVVAVLWGIVNSINAGIKAIDSAFSPFAKDAIAFTPIIVAGVVLAIYVMQKRGAGRAMAAA